MEVQACICPNWPWTVPCCHTFGFGIRQSCLCALPFPAGLACMTCFTSALIRVWDASPVPTKPCARH